MSEELTDTEANALLAACLAAGVTPGEIIVHPEYGLCLSASAVRKLCSVAPNQEAARELRQFVARMTMKVIPGGKAS